MDLVYRGGLLVGGGLGGWGAEGGFFHTFEQKRSHCVFIEVHRQPHSTGTVANSSLTPSLALLVHLRGTRHSIVDCHEFTGSQK